MAEKKNIVILGSSGSIGENALAVLRHFKEKLRLLGLAVNTQTEKLASQIREFAPPYVAVGDVAKAREFAKAFEGRRTRVLQGRDGICALARLKEADIILVGIVGSEALLPLLSAIRAQKTIALANKEAVVMAGDLLMREVKECAARLIPVDSEQNAIFQCLKGHDASRVARVYLTASGGPLVHYGKDRLKKDVPLAKVLAHPRWKMGPKITVDSATLMNKGFEVIETQHLFGIPLEKIKVVIHREALIHSMVEFVDGSLLAQMALTDMRLPIQYAFSYPERWVNKKFAFNPLKRGRLSFGKPDIDRFPCLGLAMEAAGRGGVMPCVLNAANDVAVAAYLRGALVFGAIPRVIEKTLSDRIFARVRPTLENIFKTDKIARGRAAATAAFYSRKGHTKR